MLKVMQAVEKTNSFRPNPWALTNEPFLAWRGEGARHRAFLPVARDYRARLEVPLQGAHREGWWVTYDPQLPLPDVYADRSGSKVIKTAKGGLLLVPATAGDDERLALITLRGGFRGEYSRIEGIGADILEARRSNVHCCPTAHLVVRFTRNDGYVLTETGRRCSTGDVELFSWRGIRRLPTEEYEAWVAGGSPPMAEPPDDRGGGRYGLEVDCCACGVRVLLGKAHNIGVSRSYLGDVQWGCVDCYARARGAHKEA